MSPRGWTGRQVAGAVALVVLSVAVTRDAWADMLDTALRDEESSHILLVPLVAGWLFWVRRRRVRFCAPRGQLLGPLLMAAGWAVHVAGDLMLLRLAWHLGAVVVCVGAAVCVLGTSLLLRFAPALLVLAFLAPVPGRVRQAVALPLQGATAESTRVVLECLGAPVSRAGNVLVLGGNEVMIAEACNGLRMAVALALVSVAFAFGTTLRPGIRLLVLALSPLLAILFNVVRLVPAVWLFGESPGPTADAFHTLSGWVMPPVAFLSMLGVLRALKWARVPVTPYVLAHGG